MSAPVCLIAFRPSPKEGSEPSNIPASVVSTAFARHPNGTGIAYRRVENGRPFLVVERFGPDDAARAREVISRVDASGVEYAAHWRLATSGPRDAQHAHPYTYDDPDPTVGGVAVFHNGIISIGHNHETASDTETFVAEVLAALPSRWWDSPVYRYLVSETIGYSKLVIMTADETAFVNSSYGHWTNGLWYSSDEKPGYAMYPSYKSSSDAWATSKGWAGIPSSTPPKPASPVLLPEQTASADKGHSLTEVIRGRKARRERRRRQREQGASRAHAMTSGGHTITFLKPVNRSENAHHEKAVKCQTCGALGDAYTIAQGQGLYLDIEHRTAN